MRLLLLALPCLVHPFSPSGLALRPPTHRRLGRAAPPSVRFAEPLDADADAADAAAAAAAAAAEPEAPYQPVDACSAPKAAPRVVAKVSVPKPPNTGLKNDFFSAAPVAPKELLALNRAAAFMIKAKNYYLHDLPSFGLPSVTKPGAVVAAHHLVTPAVVAAMFAYRYIGVGGGGMLAIGPAIYLGLHCSYSLMWLTKLALFGGVDADYRQWKRPQSPTSAACMFLCPLALYWTSAYFAIVKGGAAVVSAPRACLAVCMFSAGCFMHFVTEAQKHFTLAAAGTKPRLITDGMFRYTRNPNYLGRALVQASLCFLARHWVPWAAMVFQWGLFFVPAMLQKDVSLARFPDYIGWRDRTGIFFPAWGSMIEDSQGWSSSQFLKERFTS